MTTACSWAAASRGSYHLHGQHHQVKPLGRQLPTVFHRRLDECLSLNFSANFLSRLLVSGKFDLDAALRFVPQLFFSANLDSQLLVLGKFDLYAALRWSNTDLT